jgi:hypothetical protein
MPDLDDLEVIRELLTGKAPSPGVSDTVKGRLTTVIAAESHLGAGRPGQLRTGRPGRRSPRSRRTVAGMAAGGAALVTAAAISVAVMAPATSRPEVSGGRPDAIQLLAKIATAAGRQQVPRVSDSQFEYIKSWVADYTVFRAVRSAGGQAGWRLARSHELQVWISVSDLCRTGLMRRGATTVRLAMPTGPPGHGGKPPCPNRGYLDEPTYRLLQSLPASPPALMQRIHAFDTAQAGHPLQKEQANAAAFSTISDLVGESIVPPRLAAALYRAVALIPGVQTVSDAVDVLGQPEVGVILRDGTIWGPTEMIFDRKSLQMVGTFAVPSRGRAVFTAIQARAFVNRPGQLPRR